MDLLADAINNIKVHESIGRDACVIPSTKLIRSVIEVMKNAGYVSGYEEVKEEKRMKLRVKLAKKINDVGIIKPRFAVSIDEFQKYENRYIPSKDFGVLIVSTSSGIMTNREARERKIGGRLLAYVY